MAELATVGAGNGFFAGRIDFHQQQHVGIGQHLDEVFVEIAGATEAVRLIDHHQPALGPAAAHGLDHRGDFTGMVTVVVHQHDAAIGDRQLAIDLEAPPHPLEAGQAIEDGLVADAFVGGDGDGRQGVEHVVHARHVDRDRQRCAALA